MKLSNNHTPRFKHPDSFIELEMADKIYTRNMGLKYLQQIIELLE
jgi:hypothetical protein